MEALQNNLTKNYFNNLQFLQEYEPELHAKLIMLDTLIQTDKYTQQYELEYVNDDFDIFDIQNQSYIYNKKIKENTKNKVDNVTIDNLRNNFNPYKHFKFTDEEITQINDRNLYPLFDTIFPTTAAIKHYINQNSKVRGELKKLYKFIFIGTGLGQHIFPIHNKIKAQNYLIIEPNLEIFRLSLFTTKYYELREEANLIFAIAYDEEIFKNKLFQFSSDGIGRNNNWKFDIFSSIHKSIAKKIQDFILNQSHLTYPFNVHYHNTMQTYHIWSQKFNFLDFSSVHNNFKFNSKPFMLIGSGPSLGKNIHILKENQSKFILVAAYSSLKILLKNNITPDVIVHIDADPINIQTVENLDTEILNKIIFIFGISSPPKLYDIVPHSNIFCFQMLQLISSQVGNLTGESIGDLIYAMLLLLGIKEIYLLGLDLALDPDTNHLHTDGHVMNLDPYKLTNDISEGMNTSSFQKNTILIKGNFREEVSTITAFFSALNNFQKLTKQYKRDSCSVYNLNDGAFLESTIPFLPTKIYTLEYQEIDKNILHNNLLKEFKRISKNTLSSEDLEILQKKIDHAHKLKVIISKLKTFPLPDTFEAYSGILSQITDYLTDPHDIQHNDIVIVLSNYLRYTLHFIYEFFNKKETIEESIHIKNIHHLFAKALEEMIDEYIKHITYFQNKLK